MGLDTKDFSRLGPRAQKQVLTQLAGHRNQREKKTAKGNKYYAKPAEVILPDGSVRRFASEKEAGRFRELMLLERAGEIQGLRCQVPYVLVPMQEKPDGKKEQPVRYIADFVYTERGRETETVEDVKGYTDTASAAYKLFTVKRKLMLYVHGIAIKEV